MTDDLLALLIEVSSVGASGRQLKKPLTVPRPKDTKPRTERPATVDETDAAFKKGIGVLAATSRQVGK